MGGTYLKVGGSWTAASRVYIKRSGVWTSVSAVYVKRNGVWTPTYTYVAAPPVAPNLVVALVKTTYKDGGATQTGRHLDLSVSMPGGNNTAIRRIRVLTTYQGGAPKTQYGGTFTSESEDNYPNEPWSDYYYNGANNGAYHAPNGRVTNAAVHKTYPRSSNNSTNLAAGKVYFGAWAEDFNGNWSQGYFTTFDVPKLGVNDNNVVTRDKTFDASNAGTFSAGNFTAGVLKQSTTPSTRGMVFYGGDVSSTVGSRGTPNIRKAQIYLSRADDSGQATASIYIARHNYSSPGSLTSISETEPKVLGTLSKGQSKWFDLPDSYLPDLNKNINGFIFLNTNPNTNKSGAGDFSVLKGLSDVPKQGQLHVVWDETL